MLNTLKPISCIPSNAAFKGGIVCAFLLIFSITTMASSTKMPILKVSAMKVKRFKSKPIKSMRKKVEMMEVGIAMDAMSVALLLRKNKNTISTVKTMPKSMSSITCIKCLVIFWLLSKTT